MSKFKRILSGLMAAVIGMSLMAVPVSAAADAELKEANISLSRQVATEGIVLLENRENALPLAQGETVAVLGGVGSKFYKGGQGSGDVASAYVTDVLEGLQQKESEGKVVINADLESSYLSNNNYTPDFSALQRASSQSGTAIVTFSRQSTESSDTSMSDYYLSDSEKNLLETCSNAGFGKIIVVLNVGRVVDTTWLKQQDYIDAVVMAWQPGMEGGLAIADILVGDVNPSGKLVDTFAADYYDYPSSDNFQEGKYWDNYEEDIFVGYRYFETFDPNYETVNYEFGYGLSYTTFEMSNMKVSNDGANISVSVDVKNTGDMAGKEVVQVYFSAPQGRLGKPGKELAAFAKTGELAPGATETVKLSFPISDMSSFDDTGKVQESAYVLEAGSYKILVGNSVKNVEQAGTYEVAKDTVTEQLTEQAAPIHLEQRLLADGTYEQFEVGGYGLTVYADTATKIEAEDSTFRHQNAPVWFNESDSSLCVLDVKDSDISGGGNRFASFDLNVEKTGTYEFTFAGTNKKNDLTNSIRIYVDDVQVTNGGQIDLESTGTSDAQFWAVKEFADTISVDLTEGMHTFRVEFINGGSYRGVFDYFLLTPSGMDKSTAVASTWPAEAEEVETPAYTGNQGILLQDVMEGDAEMDDFLAQMTDEELTDLLYGKGTTLRYSNTGSIGNMADFGIPAAETADGPAGVRFNAGSTEIDGGEEISTTAWPIATCVACTWNAPLVEEMGVAFGKEAAAYKIDVLLAPGMNIHRNPLCGRNFEYYSEDPLVSGKMAAALVRGIQSQNVAVTIKHFTGNNREMQRKNTDTRVSERALREIYLKGFEIAVKEGGAWGVMSSYNRINNVATSESEELLTNILRKEWGFDGAVLSDWRNTGVAWKEVLGGGDVKMNGDEKGKVQNNVAGALAEGLLTRADLLACAENVTTMVMRTNAMTRMLESQTVHTIGSTGKVKAIDYNWKQDGNHTIGSENCSDTDGGLIPNYTQQGAWLRYTIDVEQGGTYTLKARVAADNRPNATIQVSVDGELIATITNDSGSAGWQDWKYTSEHQVELPEGEHTLQLTFPGDAVNLNYIEFTSTRVIVRGDVNADGKVDVADIMVAKALVLKGQWSADQLAAGDLDADGRLTVADLLKIKKVIQAG